MFGDAFKSGRRLPVLILVLLLVIAAGVYIRLQFGKVEHAIASPDRTPVGVVTPATAAVAPVVIRPELAQREGSAAEGAADALSSPEPGHIQPDRPVTPDAPLPQ